MALESVVYNTLIKSRIACESACQNISSRSHIALSRRYDVENSIMQLILTVKKVQSVSIATTNTDIFKYFSKMFVK